jgi:hypothetical protein
MKTVAWWVLALVVGSAPAWAKEDPREGKQDAREDRQDRKAERQERVQRARREMELRRTLRISDELGLPESQELALRDVLRAGDDRRIALAQSIKAEVEDLKRMGKGAPTAKDVDGRIARIQELRGNLLKVEQETVDQASKGMAPHQKARLAILLGQHDRQMKLMMLREVSKRRGGGGGPMGAGGDQPDDGEPLFAE